MSLPREVVTTECVVRVCSSTLPVLNRCLVEAFRSPMLTPSHVGVQDVRHPRDHHLHKYARINTDSYSNKSIDNPMRTNLGVLIRGEVLYRGPIILGHCNPFNMLEILTGCRNPSHVQGILHQPTCTHVENQFDMVMVNIVGESKP